MEHKDGVPPDMGTPLIRNASAEYQGGIFRSMEPIASDNQGAIDELGRIMPEAVLLPTWSNSKAAVPNKWPTITREQTADPAFLINVFGGRRWSYHRSLLNGNIAVSLGKCSGGICTMDWDSDIELENFLRLNPKLGRTLISARKRGGNVWLKMSGEYPKTCAIKAKDGRNCGEWRADKSCTVIHGQAMQTEKGEVQPLPYKVANKVPPLCIRFVACGRNGFL